MSEIDIDALRALAERATPGPWSFDGDDNEDGHGRYTSYRLYGETLSRDYDILADSINSTASTIRDERDGDGGTRYDETAQRNFAFIAAANPQTVLALLLRLEECEKALRQLHDQSDDWLRYIDDRRERGDFTHWDTFSAQEWAESIRAAALYFQHSEKKADV